MKLSARNVLTGKALKIIEGAVNSEVTLELPAGTKIVSIITNSSVENLGLEAGKEAHTVVKASNVMVVVE